MLLVLVEVVMVVGSLVAMGVAAPLVVMVTGLRVMMLVEVSVMIPVHDRRLQETSVRWRPCRGQTRGPARPGPARSALTDLKGCSSSAGPDPPEVGQISKLALDSLS